MPADGDPQPPEDLSPRAAEIWQRVVRDHPWLADDPRLRLFCEATERYETASAALDKDKLLIREGIEANPLHKVIDDNVALVRDLAAEMRITRSPGRDVPRGNAPPTEVEIVMEADGDYDPERHCGAVRRSNDKPGPRLSGGKIRISEGTGKGRPCRKPKGWGTDHKGVGRCRFHAGSAPGPAAAAAKEAAQQALATMGVSTQIDPSQALIEQVWEAAGNVAFLRARVQGLVDVAGPTRNGRTEPDIYVRMYNEERDRLARISKLALDAGIAERAITLVEHQADMIVMVVGAVLDSLDLEPPRREAAQLVAVKKLSEVAESTVPGVRQG